MKAVKLPSGKWRARAYNRLTGKTKSFTCDSKKEAERRANAYEHNLREDNANDPLFRDALEEHIQGRTNIASVRTISTYRSYQRQYYDDINDLKISMITDARLQILMNKLAETRSPKYVENIMQLATAVIRRCAPSRVIKLAYPEKDKPELNLPSDAVIRRLLDEVENDPLCVPVYLAAYGCMRRGEICALKDTDVIGNTIFVNDNLVIDHGVWIRKPPKNWERRRVRVPKLVIQKMNEHGLTSLSPDAVTRRFERFLDKHGFEHFRFHDLRHYAAAKMLSIGVPIAVVQEYGGWKDESVLLKIYNYVIDEVRDKSLDAWDAYISG